MAGRSYKQSATLYVRWVALYFGLISSTSLRSVVEFGSALSTFVPLKVGETLPTTIIYYSWNGGRAEAVCAGGKGVRMR